MHGKCRVFCTKILCDFGVNDSTDAVQEAETALNNARAAVKQTQADIAGCNKERLVVRGWEWKGHIFASVKTAFVQQQQ